MNNLQLISRFRSAIMGIAILWIFIFHIFPYESNSKYDIFLQITRFGYAGVDIFLFVSGFGLYYGFNKYKTKKQFYKKRFLRIIPTYLLIILITLLVDNDLSCFNFICMFFNIGSLGFDLPNYNWYMTAIMIFYILFPFYILWFNKAPKRNTLITSILALIINFSIAFLGLNTAIIITRIPIFCIGIYASYLLKENQNPINYQFYILASLITFAITIIAYITSYNYKIFWFYGFYWIPFIIIIPGLLICISSILDKLEKLCPSIIKSFNFLGKLSFEIYLIHINEPLYRYLSEINTNKSFLFITTFLIAIICGLCIHKVMDKIIKI